MLVRRFEPQDRRITNVNYYNYYKKKKQKRTKKCHNKAENYDNNAMHVKTEKVLQRSASSSLAGYLGARYTYPGRYNGRKDPFLSVCAVLSCVQTMVWLLVFGFFNVHTDVDACDCTRGLYGHRKRVCTGS